MRTKTKSISRREKARRDRGEARRHEGTEARREERGRLEGICCFHEGHDGGEADEAYHEDEEEDEGGFEDGGEALGGLLDLGVVVGGEAVEEFLEFAGFLADGENLGDDRGEGAGGG